MICALSCVARIAVKVDRNFEGRGPCSFPEMCLLDANAHAALCIKIFSASTRSGENRSRGSSKLARVLSPAHLCSDCSPRLRMPARGLTHWPWQCRRAWALGLSCAWTGVKPRAGCRRSRHGCIRSTRRSAPCPGNAAHLRRTRDRAVGKHGDAVQMLSVLPQTVAIGDPAVLRLVFPHGPRERRTRGCFASRHHMAVPGRRETDGRN